MRTNSLILRQHVPENVIRWIDNKHCWHLDCWLYVDGFGGAYASKYYIRAETRRAGRDLIGAAYFELVRDQFGLYCLSEREGIPLGADEIHLNAPMVLASWGDQWEHVWRDVIRPLADLWPRGEYKRRSLAFHMVRPVGVNDPCEGLANLYSETGRAARDELQAARVRAALRKRDGT